MKKLIWFSLMIASFSAISATTIGNITNLRTTTDNYETIYFMLDKMPANVTQWFYVRSGNGVSAGCQMTGNQHTMNRAYSTLLAAKSSSKLVRIGYCVDANGYGLVNEFIEIRP